MGLWFEGLVGGVVVRGIGGWGCGLGGYMVLVKVDSVVTWERLGCGTGNEGLEGGRD